MAQDYGVYLQRFQGNRDRRQEDLSPEEEPVFLKYPKPENTSRLQLLRRGVLDVYLKPEGVTSSSEGFTDEFHYDMMGRKRIVIFRVGEYLRYSIGDTQKILLFQYL